MGSISATMRDRLSDGGLDPDAVAKLDEQVRAERVRRAEEARDSVDAVLALLPWPLRKVLVKAATR